MNLFEELIGITSGLEAEKIDYALVGGLAVAVWGSPRATKDIDLLVQPNDVERAKAVVAGRGFTLPAASLVFRDGMVLERVSRVEGGLLLTVDFMLVNVNIESAWTSRVRLTAGETSLWVVSREALIAMKIAAGRPQDIADVEKLEDLDR